VTLTGGDNAAAPVRYMGTACRMTRRSLILYPAMRGREGQRRALRKSWCSRMGNTEMSKVQ
jgi:hypothetical protein